MQSLSHNQDSVLTQLPDVGANNKPPTIRPDLWKPLYSVTLPSSEQGLRLFRKLKEWRKLHELCWEPPSYLSEPYTEKQIEQMKTKLESRGGSKRETVFDIIKRQKKKMKQKIVMNQKANSIADLAAVLIEQEEQGSRLFKERQQEFEIKVKSELELMLQLAEEFEHGGLKKMDDEIDLIREMRKEGVDGFKAKLLEKSDLVKLRRKKMLYAGAVVREAKVFAELSLAERHREIDHWKTIVEIGDVAKPEKWMQFRDREFWTDGAFAATMQHEYDQTWEQVAVACRAEGYRVPESEPEPETEAVSEDTKVTDEVQVSQRPWNSVFTSKKAAEPQTSPVAQKVTGKEEEVAGPIDYKTIIPRFPPWFGKIQEHFPARLMSKKRGPAYFANMRRNAPVFTAQGVKIKWANFLDAEFAQAWPEAVEHERMDGKKELYENLQQRRADRAEKYELDLAEMVEWKRREMGLSQDETKEEVVLEALEGLEEMSTVQGAEGIDKEGLEAQRDKVSEASGKDAVPELVDEKAMKALREKTTEESAAEVAAAEELEAMEFAARESAIQTMKAVRQRRRLPPQLEGIQSEILARVQAKAIEGKWEGAPRLPYTSRRTKEQSSDDAATPAQ